MDTYEHVVFRSITGDTTREQQVAEVIYITPLEEKIGKSTFVVLLAFKDGFLMKAGKEECIPISQD